MWFYPLVWLLLYLLKQMLDDTQAYHIFWYYKLGAPVKHLMVGFVYIDVEVRLGMLLAHSEGITYWLEGNRHMILIFMS